MDFRSTIKAVRNFNGMTSSRWSELADITLQHASNDLGRSHKMGLLKRRRYRKGSIEYFYGLTEKGINYLKYRKSHQYFLDEYDNTLLVKQILHHLDSPTKRILHTEALFKGEIGNTVLAGRIVTAIRREIERMYRGD